MKVAAVKAPGFGDRRKAMLEDITTLTNGTVISEEVGIKLESVTLEMLGTANALKSPRKTQLLWMQAIKKKSKHVVIKYARNQKKPPQIMIEKNCRSVLQN